MIRWLLFLAGVVLFAVVLHRAGPARIAEDVAAQGWAIVPFILLSGIENSLHAVSSRRCVSPAHRPAISWGRMFLLYHLAYAINLVTPSGDVGGDVARGVAMRRHLPAGEAASAVLVNKFTFSLARMGVAGALAGAAVAVFPMSRGDAWIVGAASALTLAALLLFAVFQARGRVGAALVALARLAGRKRQERMRAHAEEFDRPLRDFYANHRRELAASVLYDAAGFLVGAAQRCLLMMVLLGRDALPLPMFLVAGAGVWGITNLVDMIFFFVVGRLGVREGGYEAAFRAVGLPGEKGVAVSMVDRVDQLFWTLLGLGVYWAYLLRRPVPAPEPADAVERVPK